MSKKNNKNSTKKTKLYVEGMHCAACETLIEQTLKDNPNVISANASTSKGEVEFSYNGKRPSLENLNEQLQGTGYELLENKPQKNSSKLFSYKEGTLSINPEKLSNLFKNLVIAGILIIIFSIVAGSDIASQFVPKEGLDIPGYFIFGVFAGISTCAALVGGTLLTVSKNWNESTMGEKSLIAKAIPHLMFHSGRLISFAIIGFILGLVGVVIQSFMEGFSLVISLIVALFMLLIGLQMLDVNWAKKIQIKLPGKSENRALKASESQNKIAPFITGFLTFLIPCGFTFSAFTNTIKSGNAVDGAMNMLAFAFGTLLFLGSLSFTTIVFNTKPASMARFNKVVGILLIFFAIFTLNSQIILVNAKYGWQIPDLSSFRIEFSSNTENTDSRAEIIDGVQFKTIKVEGINFNPPVITVEKGKPVKLTIDGTNATGCTSALIGKGIFDGRLEVLGQVKTVEFTPTKKGTLNYTCWMGMARGQIRVI